jgi:fused signal recognition particle receptor
MFGFFKRKKKQDPAHQEPSSDQEVSPGAEEGTDDDGSATNADTAERAGEAQPSQDHSSQAQAAEEPAEQDPESAPRQDEASEQTSNQAFEQNVEQPAEQAEDVSPGLDTAKPDTQGGEHDERPAAEAQAELTTEPETAPESRAADRDAQPQQSQEPEEDASQQDVPEKGSPEKDSPEKGKKKGWFARIKEGLGKTRANLSEGIADLFLGKKQIDDELMEDLETQLLMADVGIEATTEIIDRLTARVSRKELKEPQALYDALQEELAALLEPVAKDLVLPEKGQGPFVILMVGVNGVGKTTTIGKLAKRFQGQGRSVMLAAGDTFRAAAVEQLKVWGDRNSVPVIAQHTGADSASVIYDALSAAKARGIDVLIADTAGRLHNKGHLMEELKKVQRVMGKLDADAPHEVMLVLDAGTGQNALSQAATFNEAVPVTGITLTKLDGTAKGGIIFALAKQLGTPIRYIGVGETVDDLRPFAGRDFVDALFNTSRSE